jgi:hypothetical protein
LIYPCHTLKAHGIFFGVGHAYVCETFLDARLQNVGLRDFNVRRVRANALAIAVRRGGSGRHGVAMLSVP